MPDASVPPRAGVQSAKHFIDAVIRIRKEETWNRCFDCEDECEMGECKGNVRDPILDAARSAALALQKEPPDA